MHTVPRWWVDIRAISLQLHFSKRLNSHGMRDDYCSFRQHPGKRKGRVHFWRLTRVDKHQDLE